MQSQGQPMLLFTTARRHRLMFKLEHVKAFLQETLLPWIMRTPHSGYITSRHAQHTVTANSKYNAEVHTAPYTYNLSYAIL